MTKRNYKLSMLGVLAVFLLSGYSLAADKVVVGPLSAAGASAGQVCPEGEFVSGFDTSGNILCSSLTKTVFVTQNTYFGDLGGVTGADEKCQTAANNAGLRGVYKAWLSVAGSSPATSFTQSVLPYVTTRGDQVAANWADLTDGTLENPILRDEFGTLFVGADVWTNTNHDGTIVSLLKSCDNFTSKADGLENSTTVGLAGEIASAWTTGAFFQCALGVMHLYCFQQ